jgi:hypothetical protein
MRVEMVECTTLSQLAWDDPSTLTWFTEYERIAAESIID